MTTAPVTHTYSLLAHNRPQVDEVLTWLKNLDPKILVIEISLLRDGPETMTEFKTTLDFDAVKKVIIQTPDSQLMFDSFKNCPLRQNDLRPHG